MKTIIFIHSCFPLFILIHYEIKHILTLKFPHCISIATQTNANNITKGKHTKTKTKVISQNLPVHTERAQNTIKKIIHFIISLFEKFSLTFSFFLP